MANPILNARLPEDLWASFVRSYEAQGLSRTEATRAAVALWCGAGSSSSAPTPTAPANPLRELRAAAGLSQAQAAARMGMTRGAYANAEKASRATPQMIERARAALTKEER